MIKDREQTVRIQTDRTQTKDRRKDSGKVTESQSGKVVPFSMSNNTDENL